MLPSLLDDLRSFLMVNGFANVFKQSYPPSPDEMISLYERENPLAFGTKGINYGIRAAPIQIRVRRRTPDEAEAAAHRLFHLLDSGADERAIRLANGRNVTSRPIPPIRFEQDDKGRWVWIVKATIITHGL